MLGFGKEVPEFDIGQLEKAIHQLYLYHASFPRLRGTEETVEDFKLLLQSLAAKFTARSPYVDAPIALSPIDENQFILFLDFDGVCWIDPMDKTHEKLNRLKSNPNIDNLMNQHSSLLKTQYDCRVEKNVHEFLKVACWDPFHMQRIRLLCNQFNARIVVSSSWRNGRSDKHLKNLLDLWGVGDYYLGKTEDKHSFFCRTNCIKGWLAKNPRVRKFLILDDQYENKMKECFPNNYVKCDPLKGFDEQTYQKAKTMAQAIVDPSNQQQIEQKPTGGVRVNSKV